MIKTKFGPFVCMLIASLTVPVFCDVALVLLSPIIKNIGK